MIPSAFTNEDPFGEAPFGEGDSGEFGEFGEGCGVLGGICGWYTRTTAGHTWACGSQVEKVVSRVRMR